MLKIFLFMYLDDASTAIYLVYCMVYTAGLVRSLILFLLSINFLELSVSINRYVC